MSKRRNKLFDSHSHRDNFIRIMKREYYDTFPLIFRYLFNENYLFNVLDLITTKRHEIMYNLQGLRFTWKNLVYRMRWVKPMNNFEQFWLICRDASFFSVSEDFLFLKLLWFNRIQEMATKSITYMNVFLEGIIKMCIN